MIEKRAPLAPLTPAAEGRRSGTMTERMCVLALTVGTGLGAVASFLLVGAVVGWPEPKHTPFVLMTGSIAATLAVVFVGGCACVLRRPGGRPGDGPLLGRRWLIGRLSLGAMVVALMATLIAPRADYASHSPLQRLWFVALALVSALLLRTDLRHGRQSQSAPRR